MRLAGTKLAANHQYRGFGDQLYDLSGERPSLDLNFSSTKSLVDSTTGQNLVTFTRASSGTYVDSQGVIRTATTNLLLRSEEFDNASWTKTNSTVTANATTAPNGALTAEKLITNSGASSGRVSVSITATADTPATLSCYAKQGETNIFGLFISDGITGRAADFNLTTGTVLGTPTAGMTASIQPVGDGWYRCVVTVAGASLTGTTRSLRIVQTVVANDGTSGLFIWGAQFEASSVVGEYIPTTSTINSAPRFDHDPTTGESLGLLVEEQRTNSIRNNTMVGAVAGTPGTDPTNWSLSATSNNVTKEVVGLGTEGGIPYVDIRYSGTPTAGTNVSIAFEPTNFIAVASGQTWTESVFIKLQAGSFSGTTTTLSLLGTDGTTGTEGFSSPVITSTPTNLKNGRLSVTGTFASASTTRAQPRVRIGYTVGVAFDITLRIGLPQLEQGAFATSVIPTTTAAVTRSADVSSITGSNFSSWYRQDEGTVFADARHFRNFDGTNRFPRLFSINDGSGAANSMELIYALQSGNLTTAVPSIRVANILQASPAITGEQNGKAQVLAYALNNVNAASGGTLSTQDNSAAIPTVNQALIGYVSSSSDTLNGTIKRLTYWPTRLPNETLQRITQ